MVTNLDNFEKKNQSKKFDNNNLRRLGNKNPEKNIINSRSGNKFIDLNLETYKSNMKYNAITDHFPSRNNLLTDKSKHLINEKIIYDFTKKCDFDLSVNESRQPSINNNFNISKNILRSHKNIKFSANNNSSLQSNDKSTIECKVYEINNLMESKNIILLF